MGGDGICINATLGNLGNVGMCSDLLTLIQILIAHLFLEELKSHLLFPVLRGTWDLVCFTCISVVSLVSMTVHFHSTVRDHVLALKG